MDRNGLLPIAKTEDFSSLSAIRVKMTRSDFTDVWPNRCIQYNVQHLDDLGDEQGVEGVLRGVDPNSIPSW